MRTMKYIPTMCQDDTSGYKGHVILKVPHARDKINFLKKLNYKFDSEGKVTTSEDVTDMLMGMIDIAEDSILESHIVAKGEKKSLEVEDLFYGSQFQELLGEIGRVILEGTTPSKNSPA